MRIVRCLWTGSERVLLGEESRVKKTVTIAGARESIARFHGIAAFRLDEEQTEEEELK